MNEYRKQAEALVDQMTVEEMASQLKYDAPPIKRLSIPGYNWWNEGLHGVARAGTATVFPQAIAMAAMFDRDFLKTIADIIATEARAKYNEQSKYGDVDIYKGLTLWSPNVNIFRDPRWGRGHETYGEDPYLTSCLGLAFIKGLQGEGKYLKTAACAKHFAVHSGPEEGRHSFNAIATVKDMEETYLPAFETAVKEGKVESVMGAYNRTNGEPCCGSKTLLKDILRDRWGFEGHVVSDCWAIKDFHMHHMVTATAEESAAMAMEAGCDLNCGNTYLLILKAYEKGLIKKEQIKEAAVRLFTSRMKLGMFDRECVYNQISYEENDTMEHRQASLEASRKSVVLLKNNGILPLKKEELKTIGVIGPTADLKTVLEGNYSGTSSCYVTNLEGIRMAAGENIRILYSQGSHLYKDKIQNLGWEYDRLSEAKAVAMHSDVVVLCLGLDATIEGEEGDTGNSFAAGDKKDLYLPKGQRALLEAVAETKKPVILVMNTGSAMDLSYAEEHCDAILQCWYSGERGGEAMGEILFGSICPSGKLPVTFYHEGTLPEFTDYSMKGRTYRYIEETPLYPFGFGLSYTEFSCSELTAAVEESEGEKHITGTIKVTNTGFRKGEEVVQIYIDKLPGEKKNNGLNQELSNALDEMNQPRYSLCGFERLSLEPGESKTVTFEISRRSLETVLEDGRRAVLKGSYIIHAGTGQPDERTKELFGRNVTLSIQVKL